LFVLTNGTGNLNAERNLEVTTSSRCGGRRWCRHEDWSKTDVKKLSACWEHLSFFIHASTFIQSDAWTSTSCLRSARTFTEWYY